MDMLKDMFNDILKDLYNGNVNINEKFPISEEYNILIKESNEILRRIEEKLDDKGKKLLKNYTEKQAQIMSIDCEEKFVEGYKLATKLVISGIK